MAHDRIGNGGARARLLGAARRAGGRPHRCEGWTGSCRRDGARARRDSVRVLAVGGVVGAITLAGRGGTGDGYGGARRPFRRCRPLRRGRGGAGGGGRGGGGGGGCCAAPGAAALAGASRGGGGVGGVVRVRSRAVCWGGGCAPAARFALQRRWNPRPCPYFPC